ncbi:MAG TPA: VOC family protein [Terriglobales bacterium]|nr:VOC family protein [Terriglobales bacterium]
MAKRSLIEQLDNAIEHLLANAPVPTVDAEIQSLLRIAADLRGLPRPDFKNLLQARLQETSMNTVQEAVSTSADTGLRQASSNIREGFRIVTPYVIVPDAPALVDFMTQAFGATETYRAIGTAGGFHCEARVGDSMLMIGGGGQGVSWQGKPFPTSLHIYVPDADAVYEKALAAGATSIKKPVDQPYGDREAGIKDIGGNYWWISTHKHGSYIPAGLNTVTPYLHPRGADALIRFLKDAFGAEELSRHASSDGVVHHATIRIGESALEMGEAHGPWQPMPTMFYMYVGDVDAAYRRALQAGATSLEQPKNQPYGDRRAGATDPFRNLWFFAAPAKSR